MIANQYKYSNSCGNCDPVFSVSYVENLQDKIDRKLAKLSIKEVNSRRNDLNIKINTQNFKNLRRYNNILTEIAYCNHCYLGYDFESIVNVIKRSLV